MIKDTFFGTGIHQFELNYHFHPKALLSETRDWWLVDNQGVNVLIKLLGENDFLFARGQEAPLLGWYSPGYGEKIKSGVLSCAKKGQAEEVSFATAICIAA